MPKKRILVVACLLVASAFGAETDTIRMPASSRSAVKIPATELTAESIFIIESDTACLTLASPAGVVSIVEEAGPLRIRGKFADGTKIETRTYKAKQLWIVEALNPGNVEILVVPIGAKDESSVIRRTLIVGGHGPLPPPKPIDPVDPIGPKPDPLPSPFGLDRIVADSVRLSVPTSERAVAAKLAENYRVGAKNIASGEWSLDQVIKNQLDLNIKTPGYKPDVWQPVFKDIANRLAEARDAGAFATQQNYVTAWAEISLGFAEAAK